jgi:endogenous inhibitor of DNA gyrase (YacG/DUF329 family)
MKEGFSMFSEERLCPQCGKAVKKESLYFPYCGAKLEGIAKLSCPKCGAEVEKGEAYCAHCGFPLTPKEENKKVENPEITPVEQKEETPAETQPIEAETPSTKKGEVSYFSRKRPLLLVEHSLLALLIFLLLIAMFNLAYGKDVGAFFQGNNFLFYALLFLAAGLVVISGAKSGPEKKWTLMGLIGDSLLVLLSLIFFILSLSTIAIGIMNKEITSLIGAPLIYWLYLFGSILSCALSAASLIEFVRAFRYASKHGR